MPQRQRDGVQEPRSAEGVRANPAEYKRGVLCGSGAKCDPLPTDSYSTGAGRRCWHQVNPRGDVFLPRVSCMLEGSPFGW